MAKKLYIENDEALPAIVYAEDVPGENFTDKSDDMIAWDNAISIMDWSRRRDMIKPLFYAEAGMSLENFSSLSVEKKIIGCTYFFIPQSVRLLIISAEQDKVNGEYLLSITKKSRVDCFEAMRRYVGGVYLAGDLTLVQTQEFFGDIQEFERGFIQANNPSFRNWIFGETPYEGVFEGKAYYSEEIQEALISIYNGEY